MSGNSSAFRPSELPPEGSVRAALGRDIVETGRRLGLTSMRASVVDRQALTDSTSWSLGALGDPSEPSDPPESDLSGAASTFAGFVGLEDDALHWRRLSPRRWAYAWGVDETRAVVGAVQFLEPTDHVDPVTADWVRLVAASGVRARRSSQAQAANEPVEAALSWPSVDRRAPSGPTRADVAMLALSVISVVLATLLFLYTLPRWQAVHDLQQQRIAQLLARGERTALQSLATALSSGDYGDVQTELSGLATLGYFEDALVTSNRDRVVAIVGDRLGQTIGGPVAVEWRDKLRRLPLAIGAQQYGALWLPAAAPETGETRLAVGLTAAGLAGLASLACALVLGLRFRRRRRR